jgi:hypothetical protein
MGAIDVSSHVRQSFAFGDEDAPAESSVNEGSGQP